MLAILLLLLVAKAAALAGGPIRGDRIPRLVEICKGTSRGAIATFNAEIISTLEEIAEKNKRATSRSAQLVDGKWEL